jgi:hypothetical protein
MDFVWSDEQRVLDDDRPVPQEQPHDDRGTISPYATRERDRIEHQEAVRRDGGERAEACRPSRLVRVVA